MALPPLPLVDNHLFIDNSLWMEGMMTCHRALEYRGLYKRIPADEKVSLNFGSAIHMALEYRYVVYANRSVDDQYYTTVGDMLTSFFTLHPPPSEDWRGLNWAMELVRRYNARYEQEEFNLLVHNEPIVCPACKGQDSAVCRWCSGLGTRSLVVELPFAVPLAVIDGIHVIYSGKIDLPHKYNSDLFIGDHKTASSFTFGYGMNYRSFWETQRTSSQQKGYCWAMQKLTGEKVTGWMINAVRSTQPPAYVLSGGESRTTSKSGTKKTASDWWNETFQRERYILKPGDLEEWEQNTIALVEEFLWNYKRGYLPMKTQWCQAYGKCPYFDVCTLEQDSRMAMLRSGQYMNNEWSPLNK